MFDSECGLDGVKGPVLLTLTALNMQQLLQMLYATAEEQVYTIYPPPESVKSMTATEKISLSKFLSQLLQGRVLPRSSEDEKFVDALQAFLETDSGGAVALNAEGQAYVCEVCTCAGQGQGCSHQFLPS